MHGTVNVSRRLVLALDFPVLAKQSLAQDWPARPIRAVLGDVLPWNGAIYR